MKVVSLASGSGGNAYFVESGGSALLVDCGISGRELACRCRRAGVDIGHIGAVVVTHNHIDHVKGLSAVRKRLPNAAIFANMMTAETASMVAGIEETDFSIFENGQEFQVGPFSVTAFPIPHDVPDPVGFVIRAEGVTYFHATDVGAPLDSIGTRLAEADVATLESNHDPVMLARSSRAESLKRRIRGPRGHLANCDSAELVRRFASRRLRKLFLAHLSQECNTPQLAEDEMRRALADAGLGGVSLEILSQDDPGAVWDSDEAAQC